MGAGESGIQTVACDAGYEERGSAGGNLSCGDINECATNPCGVGSTCTQTLDGTTLTISTYFCTCDAGHVGGGERNACSDVDECANSPCGTGGTCSTPITNSYTCTCDVGFEGGGDKTVCSASIVSDSDGDGIPDSVECPIPTACVDTDSDGVDDKDDLDSDNDGIADSIEKGNPFAGTLTGTGFTAHDFTNDNQNLIVVVDGGTPQTISVVANCNTAASCATALNSQITGATVTAVGGVLVITSDTTGLTSTVSITTDGSGVDALALFTSNPVVATGGEVADTDGDGIPDYLDPDSDNDSIPDVVENGDVLDSNNDADGVSIPNYLDIDSDGDGILDANEFVAPGVDATTCCIPMAGKTTSPIDSNNNGVPDFLDAKDSDNDGIPDHIEIGSNPNSPDDTDGDGTPDYQDLDSDGDGIPDAIEKNTIYPVAPVDTDLDGIPDYKDPDSDGDGINDEVQKGPSVCCLGNGATPPGEGLPTDTDGDGIPNYMDTDSDNDGILDIIETAPVDVDGNPPDTDGDGIPNYMDTDSDNDGIPDTIEKGNPTAGTLTGVSFTPHDFTSDNQNLIVIVDGEQPPQTISVVAHCDTLAHCATALSTQINGATETGSGVDALALLGFGSDETPVVKNGNVVVDTDGDGVTDEEAKGPADCCAPLPGKTGTPIDTDGDGIPNYYDPDSDNDGISDIMENADALALAARTRRIRRSLRRLPMAVELDSDGDGLPNYLDLDSDGDGILDTVEKGPPTCCFGGDGSGVGDPIDTDNDLTPDYLDLDSDGDTKLDADEGVSDIDSNGIPNWRDPNDQHYIPGGAEYGGDSTVSSTDDVMDPNGQNSNDGTYEVSAVNGTMCWPIHSSVPICWWIWLLLLLLLCCCLFLCLFLCWKSKRPRIFVRLNQAGTNTVGQRHTKNDEKIYTVYVESEHENIPSIMKKICNLDKLSPIIIEELKFTKTK